MKPVVLLENVWKIYRLGEHELVALRDVNMCVEEGEFHCIIGPSGSGKSTLLSIIGGIERPTRGRVIVADVDLTTLNESQLAQFRRDNIGFVFQHFYLIPRLKIIENVELPLIAKGVPSKLRKKLALEALEAVGLRDKAYLKPTQISGGEMQRVAIARAIVTRPKILIADEPTGNLDVENTRRVMELFEKLNRELKITIVLATHNIELLPYCTRVTRVRDGTIVRVYWKEEIPKLVEELSTIIERR